jgi:hypothetical protein
MSIFLAPSLRSEVRSSSKPGWCLLDRKRLGCLSNTLVVVIHPPGTPTLPFFLDGTRSGSPSTSLRGLSNKSDCMRVCNGQAVPAVSHVASHIGCPSIDSVVSGRQGRAETFARTVSLHGPYASGGDTGISHHDARSPTGGKPSIRTLHNTGGQQ